jgi:hypothetical protein
MRLTHGRRRSGNAILEAALMIPLLIYFFLGAVEFARVGYTYFTLQKMLYSFARFAATRPGINLCADDDAQLTQARTLALTGGIDSSAEPILPNLTAQSFQLRLERVEPTSGEIEECSCSAEGCDVAAGGRGPDFLAARLTEGYSLQIRIPFLPTDPVILRPQVRVPYGSL